MFCSHAEKMITRLPTSQRNLSRIHVSIYILYKFIRFWKHVLFSKMYLIVAYGAYCYCVRAVCGVTIWGHIHISKPTFWKSLLTQYAYYSTRTLLIRFCTILCVTVLTLNYHCFNLGYRSKNTQRNGGAAIRNCKNIRVRECLVQLCPTPGLLSLKAYHDLDQGRTLGDILMSAARSMAYFDLSKLNLA